MITAQMFREDFFRNEIFAEYCEGHCNDDEKMFKGIFVRNLRYLIDFTTKKKSLSFEDKKRINYYFNFIRFNNDAAWE